MDSADVVDMVVVADAVSVVQDFSQSKHLHPSCVSHSISPLDNTLRSTLLIPLTLRPLLQCSSARSAYKFLSIRSQFTELTSLPIIIIIFPIASQVLSQAPICALPTQGSHNFPFAYNFPSSVYLPSILFSVSHNYKPSAYLCHFLHGHHLNPEIPIPGNVLS